MQRIHHADRETGSRRLTLLALSLLFFFSNAAHATSTFRWENRRENDGAFRLIPELSFYSTTANFTADGRKQKASGLTSYTKRVFDLYGVYGFSQRWSGYARLSYAALAYNHTTRDATRSGLTEQAFGANYRLMESEGGNNHDGSAIRTTTLDLQFEVALPMYDNVSDNSKSLPLLGDGTLDVSVGPFLSLPLGQTGNRKYALLGAGLTLRSKSHSTAIPYQFSYVSVPEDSGLMFKLGLNGFMSMSSDNGSVTQPSTAKTSDAGNSLIVDALNSSYMNAKLLVGYQTASGTQLYFNYQLALSGKSTAAIDGFTLGAMFRWAGSKSHPATLKDPRAKKALNYILDSRVKQSNSKLNLVKIDQGEETDVAVGDIFDFYKVGPNGKPSVAIARGIVSSVKPTESIVNIRQYFKQIWIEPGMIGRKIQK